MSTKQPLTITQITSRDWGIASIVGYIATILFTYFAINNNTRGKKLEFASIGNGNSIVFSDIMKNLGKYEKIGYLTLTIIFLTCLIISISLKKFYHNIIGITIFILSALYIVLAAMIYVFKDRRIVNDILSVNIFFGGTIMCLLLYLYYYLVNKDIESPANTLEIDEEKYKDNENGLLILLFILGVIFLIIVITVSVRMSFDFSLNLKTTKDNKYLRDDFLGIIELVHLFAFSAVLYYMADLDEFVEDF